jgi:hypothetical protein
MRGGRGERKKERRERSERKSEEKEGWRERDKTENEELSVFCCDANGRVN